MGIGAKLRVSRLLLLFASFWVGMPMYERESVARLGISTGWVGMEGAEEDREIGLLAEGF